MLRPLIGTFGFAAGFVPVAMMTYSPSSSAETVVVFDADVVRIDEFCHAVIDIDAVALELVLNHRNFVFDHALHAKIQIGHRDLIFRVIVRAVKTLIVKAGEMQHGFAHRLAGNRAGVDADAAHRICFSTSATRLPAFTALIAARCPPGPEPITISSYGCIYIFLCVRFVRWGSGAGLHFRSSIDDLRGREWTRARRINST